MEKDKLKTKTMYMHTLDDKPAHYQKGQQIFFCKDIKIPENLVKSLYQIRKQVELSNIWREKQGFDITHWKQSYIRVKVRGISIN